MEAKAIAKYVRMSPRKMRRVVDLIRGQRGDQALVTLRFLPHAAARVVEKVLNSAMANAENNHSLDRDGLVVTQAFVDGGPTMKRIQPHAQGRAFPIKKRTSHVTIVVGEK